MPVKAYSVVLISSAPIPHDNLTNELKREVDWIRLGEGNYFVLSDRKSMDLKNAFRANLLPTDHVLVLAVDFKDAQGWVPQTFIDWLNKARVKLREANTAKGVLLEDHTKRVTKT